MAPEAMPPERPERTSRLALVVIGSLMMLVIALAVFLVIPAELLSRSPLSIQKPTVEVLVRTACGVFFLLTMAVWTFDAIGFLHMRHAWMSKAIWGVAVSSILATSVLFFRTPAGVRRELEGVWRAEVHFPGRSDVVFLTEHNVYMTYSDAANTYMGHSDVFLNDRWLAIRSLDPRGVAAITYSAGDGTYELALVPK